MNNYWDKIYSNNNPWDNVSQSPFFFELHDKLLNGDKKILDLGCGIGRNVLPFAKNGNTIDCVEISITALRKIEKEVSKYDAKFNLFHCNIEDFNFKKDYYDLVIFYGVINSIDKDKWKGISIKIQQSIKCDGFLVASAFTDQKIAFENDEGLINYALPAETGKLFNELHIEKNDSRILTHVHFPRGEHTHSIERYLFKKSKTVSKNIPNKKRISPIGPTNPMFASTSLRKDVSAFSDAAKKLGVFLAENNCKFVGVPDKGLSLIAFESFLDVDPKGSALILAPKHDDLLSSHKTSWWNHLMEKYPFADLEILSDITWEQQVVEISNQSDILVLMGHSCGAMIEIGWTKWTKKRIFASQELSVTLPAEIIDRIMYFDNLTFDNMLFSLKLHLELQKNL